MDLAASLLCLAIFLATAPAFAAVGRPAEILHALRLVGAIFAGALSLAVLASFALAKDIAGIRSLVRPLFGLLPEAARRRASTVVASFAEGLAIAEQAGLDMNLVAEALSTGAVASPQVIRHSKRMVARDFSGASFTAALRHKDAAYAVALAETLLSGVPVSRAALSAYDKAVAHAPDDDEGKMIEIVSRPK